MKRIKDFKRNNDMKREKKFSTVVYVKNNDINKAISRLRHVTATKMKEVKERRYFEKPSDKKRRLRKEVIKNAKRRERLQEQF